MLAGWSWICGLLLESRWGPARGSQYTELEIVLATLCVPLIHDRFLKGLIVQEVLKAESCLLGVEWDPELEPERNAMCRD